MPRLVRSVTTIDAETPEPRVLAPCFRCRHFDRITPATHIVFYDMSVGSFMEREEPRICQGHVDELHELSDEKRREFFRGFPIRPEPQPCREFPKDATFKTIALAPCPKCKTADCWEHYLSWEKHTGVTLNESAHPAEDDWLKRNGIDGIDAPASRRID